jgi:hypothetical protein
MVNEAKINLKSIQESLDEQSIIASGASGVNQNYDDPIESALSQELVIEDVPINSSSSSSPKSVLPEEIEIDQASLSNSSQNLEKNNAKTDTLDEQLLNLTLTAPQNAQQIVEDRHARPTKDDGFENLLVSIPIAINKYFVHYIRTRKNTSLSLSLSLSHAYHATIFYDLFLLPS